MPASSTRCRGRLRFFSLFAREERGGGDGNAPDGQLLNRRCSEPLSKRFDSLFFLSTPIGPTERFLSTNHWTTSVHSGERPAEGRPRAPTSLQTGGIGVDFSYQPKRNSGNPGPVFHKVDGGGGGAGGGRGGGEGGGEKGNLRGVGL